jgi:hypothetical protein
MNPAVLEALPEGVELVMFFLITWAAYFAYEEVVRPWWKRGFGR